MNKKLVEYLPLIVLLFIAATLIFSVALIPIMGLKLKIDIEFIVLSLLIIISTIASLVGMLVYIVLSRK